MGHSPLIYRRNGLVFQTFEVNGWGVIKVARILPTLEHGSWGKFYELKNTEFGRLIETVPLDLIEQAINGHPKPLLDLGLRQPRGCLKKAPLERICEDIKTCASAQPSLCTLDTKKTIPECFTPITDNPSIAFIVSAWNDGFIVVKEEEQ